MFNELFKAIYGWVSYSIYQKTVSTTIFQQLVPQKAAKGVGVLRIIQKTVSTAKGVGVSSEKYPKLHLVDVMSDTWYPIPPPPPPPENVLINCKYFSSFYYTNYY